MVEQQAQAQREFRDIVRILDADVTGNMTTWLAISNVKGVGLMLSNAVCSVLGLEKLGKVGYLSLADIEKIEDCVSNPGKYGIPIWMFNRRKDLDTGENKHLVGSDLTFAINTQIRFLKKIKCYRGIRHSRGLRVRGQRTRSTGRTGRTLGVIKKKEAPKTGGGKTDAKGGDKK